MIQELQKIIQQEADSLFTVTATGNDLTDKVHNTLASRCKMGFERGATFFLSHLEKFVEWVGKGRWYLSQNLWWNIDYSPKGHTTSELFNLFMEDENKKNENSINRRNE